mmetsp:Transcript_17009/g.47440  ORF Transcript_17009/g.47440 Transcript_17009/m.47440 type:complete len:91 (+) Transcript_17009:1593-1865(+)
MLCGFLRCSFSFNPSRPVRASCVFHFLFASSTAIGIVFGFSVLVAPSSAYYILRLEDEYEHMYAEKRKWLRLCATCTAANQSTAGRECLG